MASVIGKARAEKQVCNHRWRGYAAAVMRFPTIRSAGDPAEPPSADPRPLAARVEAAVAARLGDAAISVRESAEGRLRIIVEGAVGDAAMVEAVAREAASAAGAAEVSVAVIGARPRRRRIAVASGKGGVGKSTLAANLAVALHRAGRRVGLVDADVHGPSQPTLFGIEGQRPEATADKQLIPVPTPAGVPLLSMGMFAPRGQAIAWRGPMVSGALGQMMDARWDAAELILIDLPPGTGDIQLSLIQKHRPDGVVIVSTPQDLALIDATRAIGLFRQADVPLIGLVENMAGYACPSCGAISDPFGQGGVVAAAAELGLPFLGRIPLAMAIRAASDAGIPPAGADGEEGAVFSAIAARIGEWLEAQGG